MAWLPVQLHAACTPAHAHTSHLICSLMAASHLGLKLTRANDSTASLVLSTSASSPCTCVKMCVGARGPGVSKTPLRALLQAGMHLHAQPCASQEWDTSWPAKRWKASSTSFAACVAACARQQVLLVCHEGNSVRSRRQLLQRRADCIASRARPAQRGSACHSDLKHSSPERSHRREWLKHNASQLVHGLRRTANAAPVVQA